MPAEPAANDGGAAGAASPEMASALVSLANALERQTQDRSAKSTTISVKPTVTWPTLGGQDFGVDTFLEEYEELVGLANEGRL